MKALFSCLLMALPFLGVCQLDSIHLVCECSDHQIKKAQNRARCMRSGMTVNGWVIQVKCRKQSYFFHIDKPDSDIGRYLPREGGFDAGAKIVSSGTKFFTVKLSDLEDVRCNLVTHSWGAPQKIPEGSLGEERW